MKEKVMIVDDDPLIRDMYEITLGMQGYEVLTESDGEGAMVSIKKNKPALMLLDIMLPKMHGLEVLDIIKKDPATKDIKIIMLSALSDDETQKKALKYGASDYLVKSDYTLSEVISKVVGVLKGEGSI